MNRRYPEVNVEQRGAAAVAYAQGRSHTHYEDRFRLLCEPVPLVSTAGRGEMVAVFDGIGGAPKGMQAAQHMADALAFFYKNPEDYSPRPEDLRRLLLKANEEVHGWGCISGSDRPLGGCAGTIAWLMNDELHLCHAGDTVGWICSEGRWLKGTTIHGTGKVLHRYFGIGPSLQIEAKRFPFQPEDRILLVSDGVTKVLGEEEIIDIIEREAETKRAVRRLANEAQGHGSHDDITALLFEKPSED